MATWFESGDTTRFSVVVHRINRMLANNMNRHQTLSLEAASEESSKIETEKESQAQITRPYFEVLIVDDMSGEEEGALRRRVQRKQRVDDPLVWKVVVVPSFEDALIAILFNFNLQACVIRHGFPFASEYQLDLLRKFLEDLGEGIEGQPESDSGPLLGRRVPPLFRSAPPARGPTVSCSIGKGRVNRRQQTCRFPETACVARRRRYRSWRTSS